jgi:thiamine pyrophosphokinase
LLVLNTKVIDECRLIKLWNNALVRVAVDGGTNRWHEIVTKHNSDEDEIIKEPIPDLITGDLDSIRQDVLEYYKSKKCSVVKTPDQNYTDFTKALQEVGKLDIYADSVTVFAEHSGRLDQIFGIFETLFHAGSIKGLENKPIFVVSSHSVEWLLQSGDHSINIPQRHQADKLHCGLIPLGEPCPGIKTEGLKWNLDGSVLLAFGHLVSTSNKIAQGVYQVRISTPKPLLWTIELAIGQE